MTVGFVYPEYRIGMTVTVNRSCNEAVQADNDKPITAGVNMKLAPIMINGKYIRVGS